MGRVQRAAGVSLIVALSAMATPALAATPDLAAARVQGTWTFTVETAAYTASGTSSGSNGPPLAAGSIPPGIPQVGSRADETVTVAPTCTAVGACTLTLQLANTDPTTDAGLSGLTVPDAASEPTTQSGSSYEAHTGGFGSGPCQAVDRIPRSFMAQLNLAVTNAVLDSSGTWLATEMTGTEINVMSFCAQIGSPPETFFGHLTISQAVAATVATSSTTSVAPSTTAIPPTSISQPVATTVPRRSTLGTSNSGPSLLASALASPREAFSSSSRTVANALFAMAVVLFIVFPAQLFNKTFEENYDTIRSWWLRHTRFVRRRANGPTTPDRQWGALCAVVGIGGFLGCLLSPHFGANTGSLASYVATVLAITNGLVVSFVITRQYHRVRHEDQSWRLHAIPAGLLVAAACVMVSRATHFAPGYLYGIVVGVKFRAPLGRRENGHLVALSAAAVMALGAVAWAIWVPVNSSAQHVGAVFPVVVIDDLLASMFVAAVVGTVLTMIPLTFLPGHTLFNWHRGVWSVVFGIAVFGLIEVMLHPGSGPAKPASAPWVTAVTLFVVFGGVSIVFNRYFAHRARRAVSA